MEIFHLSCDKGFLHADKVGILKVSTECSHSSEWVLHKYGRLLRLRTRWGGRYLSSSVGTLVVKSKCKSDSIWMTEDSLDGGYYLSSGSRYLGYDLDLHSCFQKKSERVAWKLLMREVQEVIIIAPCAKPIFLSAEPPFLSFHEGPTEALLVAPVENQLYSIETHSCCSCLGVTLTNNNLTPEWSKNGSNWNIVQFLSGFIGLQDECSGQFLTRTSSSVSLQHSPSLQSQWIMKSRQAPLQQESLEDPLSPGIFDPFHFRSHNSPTPALSHAAKEICRLDQSDILQLSLLCDHKVKTWLTPMMIENVIDFVKASVYEGAFRSSIAESAWTQLNTVLLADLSLITSPSLRSYVIRLSEELPSEIQSSVRLPSIILHLHYNKELLNVWKNWCTLRFGDGDDMVQEVLKKLTTDLPMAVFQKIWEDLASVQVKDFKSDLPSH